MIFDKIFCKKITISDNVKQYENGIHNFYKKFNVLEIIKDIHDLKHHINII